MDPLTSLTPALAILSAMITPAVIITACATLITSTSTRGQRVVDSLYEWIAEFAALAEQRTETTETAERAETPETVALRERRAMIFEQLDHLTSRARLLQRSLTSHYVSLGLFVATTVTIGLTAATGQVGLGWERFAMAPIVFGLLGAASLFYGCFLLVIEAGRAQQTTHREMDFLWKQGKRYAPAELLARRQASRQAGRWWVFSRDKPAE